MRRLAPALALTALLGCGRTTVYDPSYLLLPVAVISPDQLTIATGADVVLDGSGSYDPRGKKLDLLTYAWRMRSRPKESQAEVKDPAGAFTRFTPDVRGTFVVELVVSNASGTRVSLPATATITVIGAIDRPIANAGPDRTSAPGMTVVLDGTGSSDPGGKPLTFAWTLTARPAGSLAAISNPAAAAPTLKVDQEGKYDVLLEVSAGGLTAADTMGVTVQKMNHAPIANAGAAQTSALGFAVTLDGTGSSDPDGDPLTFLWTLTSLPPGAAVTLAGPTTPTPSFFPNRPGPYVFSLAVRDPSNAADLAITTVTVVAMGFDAGVVDAGKPDAGKPDAGKPDSGVPADAGPFDAGKPDAGVGSSDGGGELFDPGEIYLAGTLSQGACYLDAFAHWSTPNVASTGFDCYFDERTAVIRPSDGRLIYVNTFEDKLREYHCDTCVYSGAYPSAVLANDPVLPTPCGTSSLASFLVAPDGQVASRCSASLSIWRDPAGNVTYDAGTTDPLVALGGSGWMLTRTRVVNAQTGVAVPITGLPMFSTSMAVRWNPPDGFFVALDVASPMGAQLWRVPTSGTAQMVGTYPALPPSITAGITPKLDKAGRLFAIGSNTAMTFTDVIVRREVGGTSDVVYTEATNPLVKIHISGLVTGP